MTTKPGHRTVAEGPGGTLFRGLRLEFTSTPNAARRLVLYIEAAIASAELEGRRA